MNRYFYIILLCCFTTQVLQAQVLDSETRRELELPGGVRVLVFASADNNKQYYYLPATLQLSVAANTPEISFIVYRRGNHSPIEGGLMHLLMRWGLTQEQERSAAELLLKQTDSQAVLVGAAEITFPEKDMFSIEPGNGIAGILRRSITYPVKLPSMAAYKSAASFHFSSEDANTMWEAVHKPQQLGGVKFRGRFYFMIAHREGYVRTAEQAEGSMEGTFRTWINDLHQYHLLKIEKL